MAKLLIATGNPGKAKEFAEILGPLGWECAHLKDLPAIEEPEETGATFLANACLKASYYARATGMTTLADDSGLEVDALGGKPGVLSARWAEHHGRAADGSEGRHAKDRANSELLLEQLTEVPTTGRAGRFVCSLAVANPAGDILYTTRGTLEGSILHSPRGTNGFGYDPLFFVDRAQKATAEMASEEKHAISHRGQALRQLIELLG